MKKVPPLFLAMTLMRLNRLDEARNLLTEIDRILDDPQNLGVGWEDLRFVRLEAARLLEESTKE
jgi:hypothetical protein